MTVRMSISVRHTLRISIHTDPVRIRFLGKLYAITSHTGIQIGRFPNTRHPNPKAFVLIVHVLCRRMINLIISEISGGYVPSGCPRLHTNLVPNGSGPASRDYE
jgi:hypothetical protein